MLKKVLAPLSTIQAGVARPSAFHACQNTATRRNARLLSTRSGLLHVAEEVQDAIRSKKPVVALETTIYTHGFPYPDSLDLALRLENITRECGAVPATIGILNGVAHVGLERSQLTHLVQAPKPRKISRQDLGFVLASSRSGTPLNGGTTIAGTMILARLAGIRVFATGGLGGVHRGGELSMDISADLTELGRTPVTVICGGCKGFLDISRTLEYLETQGVGVATFADGRQGSVPFPAFWSRDGGFKSPNVLQNEAEAASVIYAQSKLPVESGLLFANPIPEHASIPRPELESILETAVKQASEAGAHGGANTPFVLNAIKELSQGRSVTANIDLVESNVRRGSKVAVELSKLERSESQSTPVHQPQQSHVHVLDKKEQGVHGGSETEFDVFVAGSIAVDVSCDYNPSSPSENNAQPRLHTSNPAAITQSVGGVGFNVARAAALSGAKAELCSVVADDLAGNLTLNHLSNSGMTRSGIKVVPRTPTTKTSQYVSMNATNRDLVMAMADMSIIEQQHGPFPTTWQPHLKTGRQDPNSPPQWLVVDGNWAPDTLHQWLAAARTANLATAFEPVSVAKAARLLSTPALLPANLPRVVDLASPNEAELESMHDAARASGLMERADWWSTIDAIGIPGTGARAALAAVSSQALVDVGVPQRAIQLLPFAPCVLVKLGPRGVLMVRVLLEGDAALRSGKAAPFVVARSRTGEGGIGGLYVRLFQPAEVLGPGEVVSVNGAGDTFLGAVVARMAKDRDAKVEDAVEFAQRASLLTLRSAESVSPEISSIA